MVWHIAYFLVRMGTEETQIVVPGHITLIYQIKVMLHFL